MKCETIRNMMSSYIDKDLNDIEKTEFEKHLTECEQCRAEYETLLDIIAVCGNFKEIELPENFSMELHQRLVEEKKKKKFFGSFLESKRMKMAAGLAAAVLVIAIGIGSSPLFFNQSMKMAQSSDSAPDYRGAAGYAVPPSAPDAGLMKEKAYEGQYGIAAEEKAEMAAVDDAEIAKNSVGTEFSEILLTGGAVPSEADKSLKQGRMVIRTGGISVNVENVDKAAADIRQLTESSGGYVENSNIDNVTVPQVPDVNRGSAIKEATEKYANLTIRVPEDKFENVFNSIKSMGKLVNENINGSDITSEYRDTEARVNNLKIQEQSLQQLMTKAKNVDEILRIESELNRVRTDIDINSGNLKRWDDLVRLSTISICMRELKPEELNSVDVPGMWEKAYQGFIKAVNNVVAGLEKIFIVLVAAVPYLIVAGVLAVAGLAVARKIKKKK